MKLAEALKLRADNDAHINDLRGRLQRSAVIQEGTQPPEDIIDLLDELNTAITSQAELIQRINHINTVTEIEPGITITAALASRDVLTKKREILTFLTAHTANALQQHRSRSSELRAISTVNVAVIQREVDTLAAELRRLDSKIQETNWSTEY